MTVSVLISFSGGIREAGSILLVNRRPPQSAEPERRKKGIDSAELHRTVAEAYRRSPALPLAQAERCVAMAELPAFGVRLPRHLC
jgi:hypothetical protein